MQFWMGWLSIALAIPALFWFRFGRLDGFAYGVTAFLMMLSLAAEFMPRLRDKYGAETEAIIVKPGRFDRLGIVWLLAIPFAPLTVWLITSNTTLTAENWRQLLLIETAIGLGIPGICVLPLIKYIRGPAAGYATLILFLGTAFPISSVVMQVGDLIIGPTWETVTITNVSRVHLTYRYQDISTRTLDVRLSDGRVLTGNHESQPVHEGRTRLLILENMKVILDERPEL